MLHRIRQRLLNDPIHPAVQGGLGAVSASWMMMEGRINVPVACTDATSCGNERSEALLGGADTSC